MTSESHPARTNDLSARVDLEALERTVAVITDVGDLAVRGIFESDDDLENFLDFVREDRRLGVN